MKMTVKDLQDKKACREAQDWFAHKFPNGATRAQAIKVCPRGDWLIWGLWNLKQATITASAQSNSTPGFSSLGSTMSYIGGAVSGVRFYWDSGVNFIAGTVRVYGYSNS